jgi:hypothetical protein
VGYIWTPASTGEYKLCRYIRMGLIVQNYGWCRLSEKSAITPKWTVLVNSFVYNHFRLETSTGLFTRSIRKHFLFRANIASEDLQTLYIEFFSVLSWLKPIVEKHSVTKFYRSLVGFIFSFFSSFINSYNKQEILFFKGRQHLPVVYLQWTVNGFMN